MQSDKSVVRDLVSILVTKGLKHVVLSPGSRHAPISISFYNHPDITCHVIPDERAAAYFAIGIIQETKSPVACVCTSGTALANYSSAAAEALYQELPLLLISADRPIEWVDQGDGQTIRQ
ncbi:MAG: 2-succinyl-5-enolpyruvyl-6-hydroxy-3-cyclohexene-1-carboxylate synthase, partial [Flavobacteriales bacterium]